MARNLFLFTVAVFLTGCALLQEGTKDIPEQDIFYIKGHIRGFKGTHVYLHRLHFEGEVLVDSVIAQEEGYFQFILEKTDKTGMYRIVAGANREQGSENLYYHDINIIFNYEDVVIDTDITDPDAKVEIVSSRENSAYYSFNRKMAEFEKKLSAIDKALTHYPEEDRFYRRMERHYNRLERSRVSFQEEMIKRYEGTLFSVIARFEMMPQTSAETRNNVRYIKDKFFREDDFSDPVLLNTSLIPEKIDRYINLYIKDTAEKEVEYTELSGAAENILYYAMTHEDVFYRVLEYLINYFINAGMEEVSVHLTENYLHADICLEEGRRVLAGEPLKTGMAAPGFRFVSHSGKEIDMESLETEYVIIFFWGSWCPYCMDIIRELSEMQSGFRKDNPAFMEVIAIGIEEDKEKWESAIEDKRISEWINYSSFSMWECQLSRKYNIEGTPSIYLLDANRKLVSKSHHTRPIRRYLSRRLN